MIHTPVLLKEAIDGLKIKKGGRYIDATFGEGGHAIEISKKGGKVLAIDADFDQVKSQKLKVKSLEIKLVRRNFKDIEKIAKENDFCPVDGVLFDLGLSMRQISQSGRGFSYKKNDELLDMRLDINSQIKADQVINSLNEDELYEIFTKYSEELNSRAVAKNIVRARRLKKITRVSELKKTIDEAVGRSDERIYARIFQALRIYVNNELESLKKGLAGAVNILEKTGRIVIISFHSLEDRTVKKFIRERKLRQINKKVITGDKGLRFERSAKLRVISF